MKEKKDLEQTCPANLPLFCKILKSLTCTALIMALERRGRMDPMWAATCAGTSRRLL